MTTLTDRYVWAVVRLLPEQQRADIDQELRSLIGDMVQARTEGPASGPPARADAIEREVLVELGDPTHLAAEYHERPRALIGPHVFPAYVRTLKVVAAIAVPLFVAASVLGAVLGDDAGVGDVVGSALGGVFNGAIQVAFWVTLFYAFADRRRQDLPWTPDELPEAPSPTTARGGVGLGESSLSIATIVIAGVALVWQHVRSPLRDADGERVPFLQPELWDGPAWAILGLLVLSLAVQLGVLVNRRWTWRAAGVNVTINVASIGLVAWLSFSDRLLNGRFFEVLAEEAGWQDVPTVDPWIPLLVVAAIEIWDGAEAVTSAYRGERASRLH